MAEVLWGGKGARTEAARSQKRLMLLELAAQMFNEVGFERTSLTDIAAELEVTKASLYYYVKNKEDILFSISKIALNDMKLALAATQTGHSSGRDQLAAFLSKYIELMHSEFGKCLVTSNKMALSEESRGILREDRKFVDLSVRNIIDKGVRDGSLVSSSSKFSTFAIFGAINWMCFWHQDNAGMSGEEITDRFLDFFLNGLRPRSTKKARTKADR